MMRWTALLAALVACQNPAPVEVPTPTAAASIENVILVTIDTLRADMLGVHGGPAQTPHLDDLAQNGLWFEHCISASMLTNPSHASLLTSLYPQDHGVYDNQHGIAQGLPTLATHLKAKGFHTASVVGFPHLNPEVSNLGQGFDQIVRAASKGRRAAQTTSEGLRLLAQRPKNKPFFAWMHYIDPHAPYDPPISQYLRNINWKHDAPMSDVIKAAPGFQRNNPWFAGAFAKHKNAKELVQRYIAEIESTDTGIGLLIAGLKSQGLWDTTALFVTSDHGENLGERDLFFHHGALYDETVHVPCLGHAPGVSKKIDQLVRTVDIAPTLLGLVNVAPWENMRGVDLTSRDPEPLAFSEHMLGQQIAVRSNRGTLIRHLVTTNQFPTYLIQKGTNEFVGQPRRELAGVLDAHMATGWRLAASAARDQDQESLRELGYLE